MPAVRQRIQSPQIAFITSELGLIFYILLELARHEVYRDQYRALIVTPDVRVSKKDPRIWKDESGVCFETWNVFCRGCSAEVGSYDPIEEMYHFHDILPSR